MKKKFNVGENYIEKRRNNQNQLYQDLKPKDRICKIISNHILPEIAELEFKFVKSRMQLERCVDEFKQVIWFRTSNKNCRDEIVNFKVYLRVENTKYTKDCIYLYNYRNDYFIDEEVQYIELWNLNFYKGWYQLEVDNNNEIVKDIADNILLCSDSFLNANSSFKSSLTCRITRFKSLNYFAPLLIPDILILAHLTKSEKQFSEMVEIYTEWKQTEEGIRDTQEGANIFDVIEGILKKLT